VNAATQFQTIDGLGVNINVNSWKGGELRPAIDYLVDTNGSSLFRVIRDPMTWVSSESQIAPLHNLDMAVLQQVYETPAMQDIWNTIGYLNQKGIVGTQIMLNFMGWTPAWLGGSGRFGASSHITSGQEQAFATMVASLVYYGRVVKGLNFQYVSPLNEQDWNCLEGPCVGTSQYRTIMRLLTGELDAMGLSDMRFVAPDTSESPNPYVSAISSDSNVFSRTDHLTYHAYGVTASTGPSYPQKNYWMTETAAGCSSCDTAGTPPQGEWNFAKETTGLALDDLRAGFAAILIYDGYDSFYYHHDEDGFWGLLNYNAATGIYTPRKRFYANAQLNRFVRPGARRVSLSTSVGSLGHMAAFYDAANGKVTIIGHNTGGSPVTINGELLNLPLTVTSLSYYQTNSSTNFQPGTSVPVSSGVFTATIPADTIFTLTN
jgi:O-glycosyl hydrolase